MSTKLHKELLDYAQDLGMQILQVSQRKHLKAIVALPGTGERRTLILPKGGNNCAIRNWKSFARKLAQGQIPVGGRK